MVFIFFDMKDEKLLETGNIEKLINNLEKAVKEGDVYYANTHVKMQFTKLMQESLMLFLDKTQKILELKRKVMNRHHGPYGSDILNSCKIVKGFLDKKVENDLRETKSFLTSGDLIKKAGIALRQQQDAYCIYLCDAAIEVFFKEVFDIPSTIKGGGIVKYLSESMILDIPKGMKLYLKEVKNKVSQMNNQIKHKGYSPMRLDAINALKVTEELYARKNRFYNLTEEEKKKFHIGIGLLKK